MTNDINDPLSIPAIAARLVKTRAVFNLTQSKFAKNAGIAVNAYNQCEKSVHRPSLDTAIKLVKTYNLTLDWIYLGNSAGLPLNIAQEIQNSDK